MTAKWKFKYSNDFFSLFVCWGVWSSKPLKFEARLSLVISGKSNLPNWCFSSSKFWDFFPEILLWSVWQTNSTNAVQTFMGKKTRKQMLLSCEMSFQCWAKREVEDEEPERKFTRNDISIIFPSALGIRNFLFDLPHLTASLIQLHLKIILDKDQGCNNFTYSSFYPKRSFLSFSQ